MFLYTVSTNKHVYYPYIAGSYIYLFIPPNWWHFYKEKHKDMLLNYKSTEHVQQVFNKENRTEQNLFQTCT